MQSSFRYSSFFQQNNFQFSYNQSFSFPPNLRNRTNRAV
nr:MAG TPA: hypothetical protein [Caudoviricetes sp.]